MRLYERDYEQILTAEEDDAQKLHMKYASQMGIRNTGDDPLNSHPNIDCRKFLWLHNSHFPNNCLWLREPQLLDLSEEANAFEQVLDSAASESDIQAYIKNNRKWFVPGVLFKDYCFGHHDAYLFPELQLGTKYRVDYALLGESSDGFSIVLVEFENANTEFLLTSSNGESSNVRRGMTQIKDWKRWLDNDRDSFIRTAGLRAKGIEIPTSRFHYCLVVSRRKFMNERARDVRSQICYEMQNTKIISFDRIVDNLRQLAGNMFGYWG